MDGGVEIAGWTEMDGSDADDGLHRYHTRDICCFSIDTCITIHNTNMRCWQLFIKRFIIGKQLGNWFF